MKIYISIIFFLMMASTVNASKFIELSYDAESIVTNQKFILMVDMKIGPRDSKTEIYIESSLGSDQLKMVRFSETQFATVVSGKELAGNFLWTVRAYFQDGDYFKKNQLHNAYIDDQIDNIKLKILEEIDPVKLSLLSQAIQDLEQERNTLNLEMKNHRQHLETIIEEISVLPNLEAFDNDVPYLTMNYIGSRAYLEDLDLKFKINEGNKGPYLYNFNSTINTHSIRSIPATENGYLLDISNGKIIVGENSLSIRFTYANIFKLEAVDKSIISLAVRKTKVSLLRDSSLEPSLKSYYQKKLDDLNMINDYFLSYRGKLFKEGQEMSDVFHVGVYTSPAKVSSGYSFACGIYRAGAYCWGKNDSRQLGLSHQINTSYPTSSVIGLDTNIHQISAGQGHACALKEMDLYCWGTNFYGEVGGGNVGGVMPVTKVSLPGEIQQVAAGGLHTCAIADGAVYCWGSNQSGQLGRGNLSGGGVPIRVEGLENVIAVRVGLNFTCALTENKKVFCWGANGVGQAGSVETGNILRPHSVELDEVVDISVGDTTSCALRSSGGVFCWGSNAYTQMGQNAPPYLSPHPIEVYGLENGVTSISVGSGIVCAVQNSKAKCLGLGRNGSLGHPNYSNTTANYPVEVSIPEGRFHSISMGRFFGCASIEQKTFCWGENHGGNIGNGTGVGQHALNPVVVDYLNVSGRELQ